MATSQEVLRFLIPNGGWVMVGDDYEGISFVECDPITKAQFEAGFAKCDAAKIKKDADESAAKAALLAKLGITEDEAKLLLS